MRAFFSSPHSPALFAVDTDQLGTIVIPDGHSRSDLLLGQAIMVFGRTGRHLRPIRPDPDTAGRVVAAHQLRHITQICILHHIRAISQMNDRTAACDLALKWQLNRIPMRVRIGRLRTCPGQTTNHQKHQTTFHIKPFP